MSLNCIIYNSEIILTDLRLILINGLVYQVPDYIQIDSFNNLLNNSHFKINNINVRDISKIEWKWREKDLHSTLKKIFIPFSINIIQSSLVDNDDLSLIMMYNKDGMPNILLYSKIKSFLLINNKYKSYCYRYVIYINNNYIFDFIEDALYNKTHDKLHDKGLINYHIAEKPQKVKIQIHLDKKIYTINFWFDDKMIREVFDKFYGAHPDTKTDFIIRIDAEQRKYELALYRYGLKEPQIIPEDVYQLLVFKNKFEDYRSENYNQERGAWIW